MPGETILEIPVAEQAQMWRELRAARYGYLRALHIQRARYMARDDDPQRRAKLARMRSIIEGLLPTEALFFAAELDIHLLAKIGYGRASMWSVTTTAFRRRNPAAQG
ncbi:MAG: hypothetical protein MSG64_11655 [Pyrinomonadaceae bacterium MAG19_C2-C3]|nr:hypothetical protein [Pyrinomonadaceae bacterium MAG19_C2-C3]